MEYRRFENTIVARIDRGEEVLENLAKIAAAEKIKLASVQAIGATDEFEVGAYNVSKQAYKKHEYKGEFEIISLLGSINTLNSEYYAHLHMSAGDEEGRVFGGHLNRAVISGTCEMTITLINGEIDRYKDDKSGLNVYKF